MSPETMDGSLDAVNRLTTVASVAIVGEPTYAFDIVESILRYSVTAVQIPEKRLLYMLAEWRTSERSAPRALELFLFDLLAPFRYDWRDIARRLRHEDPNVAIVVLADSPATETIDDAMRAEADELLYEPELSFPNLVWQRIGGLIDVAKPVAVSPPAVVNRLSSPSSSIPLPPSPTLSIAAPDLRASSGRLDATKIAKRLGVPIARLAAVVGVSRQALSQTPDSPGIQYALDPIAQTLHLLDNSLEPVDQQKWLRTSRGNLDRKTPLESIMSGNADAVVRMLGGAID